MDIYLDGDTFNLLGGLKLQSIQGLDKESEEVILLGDGWRVRIDHKQDCCETVYLEDFEVSSKSVNGSVILNMREEVTADQSGRYESATWTFYHLDTTKGSVWFRFLGTSNGYYSEAVRAFLQLESTEAKATYIANMPTHKQRALVEQDARNSPPPTMSLSVSSSPPPDLDLAQKIADRMMRASLFDK